MDYKLDVSATGVQFLIWVRLVLGTTWPPTQWIPELMWPRCEDDHSPPSSAEVKNTRLYTSTPPYAYKAWCLSTRTTFLTIVASET
jgi:hypothetical protein